MEDNRRSGGLRTACEQRRTELEQVLEFLGKDDTSGTRKDIESALAALASLMTGDLDHLASMTSERMNRWLQSSKHLGLKEQRAIAATRGAPRPA